MASSSTHPHGPRRTQRMARRQDGAFAIMFVPLLIVMIGFCALAIDMGFIYNRKADLSGLAKAVALAAARELNGTPAGIQSAKAKARETAERLKYFYFGDGIPVTWSDDALSFGASASRSGTWTPASSFGAGSSADASSLFFAKVDSNGLDRAISTVETFFIRIFASGLDNIRVNDTAIAGRASINVLPIGVCAMSPDKYAERNATASDGSTLKELVQYGFRRGVSYDLMQLNPNGTEPARFGINPAASSGTSVSTFNASTLKSFLCNGSMWMPGMQGGHVRVLRLSATAPLSDLYPALNSRFNAYDNSVCESRVSPPDANIKAYAYDLTDGVKWMDPTLGRLAAATTTTRGWLETVADLPDDHPTVPSAKGDYGPLWSYARAVKAPSPVNTEPSGGYQFFDTTAWGALYRSGPAGLSNYPAYPATPYQSTSSISGFHTAPSVSSGTVAARQRRILHIPLLSCSPPIPAGVNAPARVEAIGKFFMTVRATEDKLIAEFAGLVAEQSLSGEVRLYP